MEAYRNSIVLGSLLLYFVMCIGVGLWAMRRTKSSQDFFMAGRELGIVVTAFALFSSTLSGFGFVGGNFRERAVDRGGAAEEVVLHGGVLEHGYRVRGGVGVEGEHVDYGIGLDVRDGCFETFEIVSVAVNGFDVRVRSAGRLSAIEQDGLVSGL